MIRIIRSILFIFLSTLAFIGYGQDVPNISPDSLKLKQLESFRQHFHDSLPKPIGWVNDFEQLFSTAEIYHIDSIIGQFKKQSGIEIAVVTIDTSLVSKDNFEDLTLHMANSWGLGERGKNNGLLIGISRGYRKMRIENGYLIETLISDEETKQVIDHDFIPEFKLGNYYQGTLNGINQLISILLARSGK